MKKDKKSPKSSSVPWRVVRVFIGERTAEQVAADLMKVHSAV